mmetsp:Transcript_153801/g.286665  ORF Transcript_153801/g.286665 Transcript_153801/m.286665 type:complete len:200 (+) Transcript_153801:379-978(+)
MVCTCQVRQQIPDLHIRTDLKQAVHLLDIYVARHPQIRGQARALAEPRATKSQHLSHTGPWHRRPRWQRRRHRRLVKTVQRPAQRLRSQRQCPDLSCHLHLAPPLQVQPDAQRPWCSAVPPSQQHRLRELLRQFSPSLAFRPQRTWSAKLCVRSWLPGSLSRKRYSAQCFVRQPWQQPNFHSRLQRRLAAWILIQIVRR